MDKQLEKYKNIIRGLLHTHEKRRTYNMPKLKRYFIEDESKRHFALIAMGQDKKEGYIHDCIFHIEVSNKKVWLHEDSTDADLAAMLVDAGIPDKDIIATFVPPYLRDESRDYPISSLKTSPILRKNEIRFQNSNSDKYKKLITEILESYNSSFLSNTPKIINHLIKEEKNNHFALISLGWPDSKYVYEWNTHIQINNDKIWIHKAQNSSALINLLISKGVFRKDIELKFENNVVQQELSLKVEV